MTCESVQAALTALLDTELSADAAADATQHLAECSACAKVYAENRAVREMASAWSVDAPDISAHIQSAIAADEQRLLLAELPLLRREMQALRAEVSELRRQLPHRADMPSWSPLRRADFSQEYPRMENDPWNLTRS